jgi:hypothetical protein
MARQTVLLNGSSSLMSSVASDSDWMRLDPGVNSLTISSASSSDTGTLEVLWYSAVVGL